MTTVTFHPTIDYFHISITDVLFLTFIFYVKATEAVVMSRNKVNVWI